MGRYGNVDYPRYAKGGFLLGLALILGGAGAEAFLPLLVGPLPPWEDTLLVEIEALGVVLFLFAPLVFGVIMPLTE